MTVLSDVGLLSLLWVWLFHAGFLSRLPSSSFLEGLSSGRFAELGSVQLLAFSAGACSLACLSSRSPFLAIDRAVLVHLVLFFCLFFFGVLFWGGGGGWGRLLLFLSLFSDFVDFSYYGGSFLLFSSGIFHASSTVPFFFLVLFFLAGLHCLLRMLALNSCVGDTWQRLWRDDITHNGKQAVNRLKIPQGLSTLMFRRWSEVPSRGGVRGDSP